MHLRLLTTKLIFVHQTSSEVSQPDQMTFRRGQRERRRRVSRRIQKVQKALRAEKSRTIELHCPREIKDIGMRLVESVTAWRTPPDIWPQPHLFEITNSSSCGPKTNIITIFDGIQLGWAGNIDNESSLPSLYQLMPFPTISFILTAGLQGCPFAASAQLTPTVFQMFRSSCPSDVSQFQVNIHDEKGGSPYRLRRMGWMEGCPRGKC